MPGQGLHFSFDGPDWPVVPSNLTRGFPCPNHVLANGFQTEKQGRGVLVFPSQLS